MSKQKAKPAFQFTRLHLLWLVVFIGTLLAGFHASKAVGDEASRTASEDTMEVVDEVEVANEAEIISVEEIEAAKAAPVEPTPEVVDVATVTPPAPVREEEDSPFMSFFSTTIPEKAREAVKDVKVKTGLRVSDEQAEQMKQELERQIDENVEERLMRQAVLDRTQIDCLVRALVFEAGGEPRLGKLWVLHVIENRVEKGYRGKSNHCDVIFDHKQFSFANINPDRVPKYSADLIESVQLATDFYRGKHADITDCATHYLRTDHIDKTKWARQAMNGESPEGLVLKATIGEHSFFGPAKCQSMLLADGG